MADDPYKELGVGRTASDTELQKAFRKLAKELHPDKNQGNKVAEERFKRVSAAYDFLSDADRRKRFDAGMIDADGREVHRGFNPGAGGFGGRAQGRAQGSPFGAGAGGSFDGVNLEDIFDMFGSGGRARPGAGPGAGAGFGGGAGMGGAPSKGQDIRLKLDIDLLDTITGNSRRVVMSDGRTLDVNIPKGSKDGQTLRLKGQGGPAPMGRGVAGDVLIELSVRPHPLYRPEGGDLHMDLFVSLPDAILGGKVQAPTPDGPVSVNLGKNTASGSVLRLKGRGGIGPKSSERGDLFAHIFIAMPDKGVDGMDEPLKSQFMELMTRWRDTAPYVPTVSPKKR